MLRRCWSVAERLHETEGVLPGKKTGGRWPPGRTLEVDIV